jgi:hypothetical protein
MGLLRLALAGRTMDKWEMRREDVYITNNAKMIGNGCRMDIFLRMKWILKRCSMALLVLLRSCMEDVVNPVLDCGTAS